MDEAKIRKIIKEEIQKEIQKEIRNHKHTGLDSLKIPIGSIETAGPLNGGTTGVLSPDVLGNQKVNNEYTTDKKNPNTINTIPLNIIYGFGVGTESAFNAGDAPNGTILFFENGLTLSGLWIKTENGWYGISPDSTL